VTDRTRTYTWHDPLGVIEEAAGLSGLDVMRLMVAGQLPQPPISKTLGFRLVEVEHGRAVFECEPAEYHYNPIGSVHAGLASTLLDSAMGCAFATTLEPGVGWTTLELKANFTRALSADTGLVHCVGSVLHPGRTVATTEAKVEDAQGRLYAHGTSTILVLGRRE
jgi:uncharacterized protein (TIGR00369 family)